MGRGQCLQPRGGPAAMGNSQSGNWGTFKSGEDIAKFESDLQLLRSCSPEAEFEINWDEERSVMSHVTINTMENIVIPARLARSKSLSSLTSKLRKHWGPNDARADAGRGTGTMKRSVSFSTPLQEIVDIDGCCAADADCCPDEPATRHTQDGGAEPADASAPGNGPALATAVQQRQAAHAGAAADEACRSTGLTHGPRIP